MDGEGNVIILLRPQSVGIPAIPQIEGFVLGHGFFHPLRAVGPAYMLQGQISDDVEILPIVLRERIQVNLPQPFRQMGPALFRQWLPQLLRNQEQSITDGGHLHHPLILVLQIAPIFRGVGVSPVGETLQKNGQQAFIRTAACPIGNHAP
ncbi:hypothetical protein D3C75_1021910 [compost metagenome]